MLERNHSKQFDDLQARDVTKSKGALPQADAGYGDLGYHEEYQPKSLSKQRDRQDKVTGNFGSNQDLSQSSQSKTVQTQKRQWKATDADSKERKNSPFGDNFDDKMAGYGASFQNKDMFSGGKNNFDDDRNKQNNPVNVTAFNKDKDFGKSSSVSPVRSKPEAVQEQTKPAEPA